MKFKDLIARILFPHRRLWTVVYPDGQKRSCCCLSVAKDYRELHGGKVEFLGKFYNQRTDHFA